MNLYELLRKIDRPVVFFDLETTGLNEYSRIIEIGAVKYRALERNGSFEIDERYTRVNPDMEISAEITELTGITNEMVKDKPRFKDIAAEYYKLFTEDEPVIAGYNHVGFDVPFISKEFERCGFEFPLPGTKYYDMLKIFRNKFPRTLENAYKYFVSEKGFDGAHNALNDTMATVDVFIGELEKYPDLEQADIHEYCGFANMVDFAGHFKKSDDETIIFNFGKFRGEPAMKHLDYLKWMLGSEFPTETKNQIKNFIKIKSQNNDIK